MNGTGALRAGKTLQRQWLVLMSLSSDERIVHLKMPPASARANSARFILLIVTTFFPVSVGRLFGLIFADRFAGHVAWVVMERPRLLFARLLLVRILVVGHGILR
jgi:hypothetical protein